MIPTWPFCTPTAQRQFATPSGTRTWSLGVLLLVLAAPVCAQLDPAALMEAVRNDAFDQVKAQLAKGGTAGRNYLRRYAQVMLPAVARFGSPTILTLLVDTIGRKDLNPGLNAALVSAFDNPQFHRIVEQLLDLGANPSAQAWGNTALARAVFAHARRNEAGALETARLLLARGADKNAAEDSGMSPLMWACNSDDRPMVELLLSHGADPELRNREGRSAALIAGPACAKLLQARGGNPPRPVASSPPAKPEGDSLLRQDLYQAVATSDRVHVAELLEEGASANMLVDEVGQTLLMKATDGDIVRLLLGAGADANRADTKGWTALHHAVICPGMAEVVKALLAGGADVQRHIENGQTALLLAHILFVDNVDPRDGREILQLLVQAGADIHAEDRDGETLLHIAAYNNAASLAQTCLELGADPQRPNGRGETPLRLAERLKADRVLEILTRHELTTESKAHPPASSHVKHQPHQLNSSDHGPGS